MVGSLRRLEAKTIAGRVSLNRRHLHLVLASGAISLSSITQSHFSNSWSQSRFRLASRNVRDIGVGWWLKTISTRSVKRSRNSFCGAIRDYEKVCKISQVAWVIRGSRLRFQITVLRFSCTDRRECWRVANRRTNKEGKGVGPGSGVCFLRAHNNYCAVARWQSCEKFITSTGGEISLYLSFSFSLSLCLVEYLTRQHWEFRNASAKNLTSTNNGSPRFSVIVQIKY